MFPLTKSTFTCSKSTLQILNYVLSLIKVSNKDTRLVIKRAGVFIVNYEQYISINF